MLLARLSEALGVSGDEGAVRDLILEEVRPYIDAYRVDPMG
ncbi:MAG: peptidase M42, partial [Bacillota bacterium]